MNINFGLHSQRRKGGFKFMRYQPHIRCNIAYTPWPSAYCPPLCTSITSATLHLLSVLLSRFQPNTDTGHLVLFQDCGSILLAVDPENRNWVIANFLALDLCWSTCLTK